MSICERLLLSALLLGSFAPAQQLPATGAVPAELVSLDSKMQDIVNRYSIPGATFAVAHNGRLLMARGYGYSNVASRTMTQPDSLFRVASVSKQYTAAAIMKLIEHGQLRSSDKAFSILSDLRPLPGSTADPRAAQITIQNLLDHRSGWYGAADGGGYDPLFDVVHIATVAGTAPPADPRTIARYMLGRPLDRNPGTYSSYSNFGYLVLGLVVSKVSGQSYESFVTANITGPISNNRTQFGATLTALPDEVSYYDQPGTGLVPSVFPTGARLVPTPYGGYSLEANHANGGLVSSTIDLIRFVSSVNGSRVPALFQTPVQGRPGYLPPYGPGWTWMAAGSLPGTNSAVLVLPDQTVLSFLANTRPAYGDGIIEDFLNQIAPAANAIGAWPSGIDLFPQYATSFTVEHAADFQIHAAAPDELVTLFGYDNLAPSTEAATSVPLPTTLGGASFTLSDSTGANFQVPLVYASPGQVNILIPPGVAGGQAKLALVSKPSVGTTIQIDPVAPAIFTANGGGTGVPAGSAAIYRTDGSVTPVDLYSCSPTSCVPGSMSVGGSSDRLILTVYGSGIRHASAPVTATAGTTPAPVSYAGPQGQFVGLDQINIQIPYSLRGAGQVALTLTVDGRATNPVTISLQ